MALRFKPVLKFRPNHKNSSSNSLKDKTEFKKGRNGKKSKIMTTKNKTTFVYDKEKTYYNEKKRNSSFFIEIVNLILMFLRSR